MIGVGADLSKRFVYVGCVDEKKFRNTGTIEILDDAHGGFLLLKKMFEEYVAAGATYIWIEQPWARNANARPLSSLELGRTSGIVEIAAHEAGLIPHFVNPGSWRLKVFGYGRPADPKETARQFARDELGFETKHKKDHNLAESLCLAYYGIMVEHE